MEVFALLFLFAAGLSFVLLMLGLVADTAGWVHLDKAPEILLATCVVCVVGFVVCAIPSWAKRENALMAECLKDHKEYECVSMLRKRGGTTVVPVVIPTR